MGVKGLRKVIEEIAPESATVARLADYAGQRIGVDASLVLHQYAAAVKGEHGNSTVHIQAVLQKASSLLRQGIQPVFVFDGQPPAIKDDTRRRRGETRGYSIVPLHVEQCREVLEAMGVPCVQAPEEADAQLAHMQRVGLVQAVLSEDMDLLALGCSRLIRSRQRTLECIDLRRLLEDSGFSMAQFVDLCILLGTDYNDNIRNVGPKRSLRLLRQHGRIEQILATETLDAPARFDVDAVRSYFSCPRVQQLSEPQVCPLIPDRYKLTRLLRDYGFAEASVMRLLQHVQGER